MCACCMLDEATGGPGRMHAADQRSHDGHTWCQAASHACILLGMQLAV